MVFCASLDSAIGYWDTGEAQVVPWIFGIMHATGFPAFTLLAGVFAHVVPFGSVAWRVTVFCAVAMSAAAWLVSRIVVRLEGDPWIAAATSWVFAFGYVVWTRGTRAEVHALAAFFAVASLYAALRWYRTGEVKMLAGGALLWGLGIATHPIDAMLLPAWLVLFAARARRVSLHALCLAIAAVVFGVAWYGYLPARSAAVTAARLDPTRSLGLPSGRAFWDNNHPSTWEGFVKEVGGTEFGAGGTFGAMLSPHTYATRGPEYVGVLLGEVTPLGVLLAAYGAYLLWKRDRWLATALLAAFCVPTAFALAYTIEADPRRYEIAGFAVVLIFAAYGASAVAQAFPVHKRALTAAMAVMAIALLFWNRQTFDQRNDSGAQGVIASVVKNTPRNAVLISPWLFATPLAYGAYVERRLGGRIVESAWLADDAAYVPEWTRERPVYVVGILFGSVPGYVAVKIATSPDLYRVVPAPPSPRSSSRLPSRISVPRRTTTMSCSPARSCTGMRGSRGPAHTSTH